jgi:hypothetical protein
MDGITENVIPTIQAREQGCLFFMLGNAYASGHDTCRLRTLPLVCKCVALLQWHYPLHFVQEYMVMHPNN